MKFTYCVTSSAVANASRSEVAATTTSRSTEEEPTEWGLENSSLRSAVTRRHSRRENVMNAKAELRMR